VVLARACAPPPRPRAAAGRRACTPPETGEVAPIAEFLAGLFVAPLAADAVASCRDGLGADFLDLLVDAFGCASGVQMMRAALLKDASPAVVAHQLAMAFTVLFDGVGGHRAVSPYESAHVGSAGRLFQAPVSDMARLLRQADVSIADTVCEPPDHLSIELALLARLMRSGASAAAEAVLLDDHLLGWVPMFAERCRAADSTGFYAGAARVAADFLLSRRAACRAGEAATPQPGVPNTSYAPTQRLE
jgi:TorA specific chaperone